MVTLKQQEEDAPDPVTVEVLYQAAANAMERACIPDFTSPSEILSASFTLLARTLAAMRHLQDPADAAQNAKEVKRVLEDFIVTYGTLPN